MSQQYSNEMINAFIDGELDAAESTAFRASMKADAALAKKVQHLCALKSDVVKSYRQVPVVQPDDASTAWSWQHVSRYSLATSVILMLGVLLGWVCHVGYLSSQQQIVNEAVKGLQLEPVDLTQSNKMIIHIASSKPAQWKKAIDQIDTIIHRYQQNQLPFELEVIANAGGINLLRNDTSPYRQKITQMMDQHRNVAFIACNNAVDRLKLQGIDAPLIPRTRTGVTAVSQIVQRLQQGWVYIKA